MNFQEAEARYRELRSKRDAGALTGEEFRDSLKSLMTRDDQGRFWNIGADTGRWYRFDEGEWVEDTPPGLAGAPPVPPPPPEEPGAAALPAWWEEPGEDETVLVSPPPPAKPAAAPTIIGTPSATLRAGLRASPSPPRLVVASGSRRGEKFTLTGEVRLGRDEDNDVVLDDPRISRHHAVFRHGAGGYTVVDLGSANGTFVNGQPIAAPHVLAEGDTIVVGDTELTYHAGLALGAPAAEPAPGETAGVTLPPAPQAPPPLEPYAPPPPPPPAYAPPPPAAPPEPIVAPAKKRGFPTCLIVIIVLAILLCCAVAIVGALVWQMGGLEGVSML